MPDNEAPFRVALAMGAALATHLQDVAAAELPGRFELLPATDWDKLLSLAAGGSLHGVILARTLQARSSLPPETLFGLLRVACQNTAVTVLLGPNDADGSTAHLARTAGFDLAIGAAIQGTTQVEFDDVGLLADLLGRMEHLNRPATSATVPATPIPDVRPAPAEASHAGHQVVVVTSPVTGSGKSTVGSALAALAGHLGISTLGIDAGVLPPGNFALRLGITTASAGLELLLQQPWDDATYRHLHTQYGNTTLQVLRPISDAFVGTLTNTVDGAYRTLLAHASRDFTLTVMDTSPYLDDASVADPLSLADKVVIVLDPTRDRLHQAKTRLPWILNSMPDPRRAIYVVNRQRAGRSGPEEIMEFLGLADVKAFALPDDPARHDRAAATFRPVSLESSPRDPWGRLFTAVVGDLVPPSRTRWRPEHAPKAQPSGLNMRDRSWFASKLRWLAEGK